MMAPHYFDQNFYDVGPGRLTPEEPQNTIPLVDSPLETRKVMARIPETTPESDLPPKTRKRSDPTQERRNKRSEELNNNSTLRFMIVDHPDGLKDKTQMRKNRIHVMHNYLAKEAQKPDSKDLRVHGTTHIGRRRRTSPHGSNRSALPGTSLNGTAPQHLFRPDISRLTPSDSVQSSGSSVDASDQENGKTSTKKVARMSSLKGRSQSDQSVVRHPKDVYNHKPLVDGIGGSFPNSEYMRSGTQDIPFFSKHPGDVIGSTLEPFESWPAFSDSTMKVNELKWSCSQRFGSSSLSMHWIPTMLRARHAFLSSLCISSAHDDIMHRALLPSHLHNGDLFVNRIRVRQGVISMIQESMNDPEMRAADETIIAVLHVLNSEVMGCNDQSMRIHQIGLHEMVRERGGLERLGVNGQLAGILTITMYLIGALRETPPHRDFIQFASKQVTKIPTDPRLPLPESPVYYRPGGFYGIKTQFAPGSETYDLLDTLRVLTNKFYVENQDHSTHMPTPMHSARFVEQSNETVSSLYSKIFAIEPAANKDFNDMNERYTFEAIRLVALVYAHALANKIPFSKAAAQIRSSSKPSSYSTYEDRAPPIPIQIKNALVRTDTSYCWDHLAGVLFWVTLIAGATANPGPISNEERVGEDEDARKWITAIAVRCCIVLSFEYGQAVMETLKRVMAIETLLGQKDPDDEGWNSFPIDQPTTDSEASQPTIGPAEPPPLQRGFADFAQEFMNM